MGDVNLEELLPGYAAGELGREEEEMVESALTGSAPLREELARYERLFVLLSAAASEEVRVPRDLRARTMFWVALGAYLEGAARLAEDLLGAYGRAFVYYLGLA